jgi:hypothetical protein
MVGPRDRNGAIELSDFAQVCEAIAKALKNVEEVLAGCPGKTAFQIHQMRSGSAVLVVDAVRQHDSPDRRGPILSTFRRAVGELNKGTIGPDLAALDLEPYRDIARVLRNGGAELKIGRVRLTPAFLESLDKVAIKGISSIGSVTGVLDRVNMHDRNELSLYPPGSGKQIACRFPDSLLEDVREGLKRTVTVSGELQYVSGEPFPRRCNVTKITVHPAASALPTLFQVRDLGLWGTDGLSAVDFIRAIRDE